MSRSIGLNHIRGPRSQPRAQADAPPPSAHDDAAAQQNQPACPTGAAGEGSGLIPFLALTGLAMACLALRALLYWPLF
jgi:hypothetical protein